MTSLRAIFFAVGAVAPQKPSTITPTVACGGCRLERSVVATLDSDHAIRPSTMAHVAGEFLLVPDGAGPRPIKRFDDRTGRYVGNVGRLGRGPGELLWPEFLAGFPGDSLFVFDYSTLHYSILAPVTFRYVRGATVTVGRPTGAVLIPSGGPLWIAATVAPAAQVGYPLHMFTPKGVWLRSVGAERPLLRWNDHVKLAKRLAPGPDGSLWAVSRYGPMSLEVFDGSGRLTRSALYQPAWLPDQRRPQRLGEPPPPERVPFAVRSEDQALIATLVPADDWQRGIVHVDDPTHGPGAPVVGDVAKLFDSVVEWFDLARNRIVYRARLDEAVVAIMPGDLVALYREGPDGTPILWIERWSLREHQ